ncbi:MAG: GGDEF domain-containing protein [Oscillospiraceae bacterium]|nr:GGDEF domain-containing protein [Oscillospiraceae bacterium]
MSEGKKTVAILTGSFHTDYSHNLAQALCGVLREAGFAVCLLQGLDASRFLSLAGYEDEVFDSHYYTQFEYSKFFRPDYLVVSLGTISALPNAMEPDALLDRLPDVPTILLETELARGNCVSVTVDNCAGMEACVEHLIAAHGCRELLFVSGPKTARDAQERLRAYRSVMARHGLPVTDSMIAAGDFTDHVEPQIEALLAAHPHPDAIVCANDEMAESAYRVLRRHGLEPGRDVAVTGFDDSDAARYADPPLTSVRQDMTELSRHIVALIQRFEAGERPGSVRLRARLCLRRSCGCAAEEERASGAETARLNQSRAKRKRLTERSMQSALILRKLLHEDVSETEFFRQLGRLLAALGLEYSELRLLPEAKSTAGDERISIPDRLCLRLRQHGDEITVYPAHEPCVLCAGTPCAYPGDAPLAAFPLFFGQMHYGVFIVALPREEMLFCYALSLEIGTGLRYLHLALEQQGNRAALEEKNQVLDYTATHDSLTGLYNRRGTAEQLEAFLRRHGREQRYAAVMADLDHLKQINDGFGHGMGDTAIRTAAELLREVLPAQSVLGRTGGDEFVALFLAQEEDADVWFRRSLAQACERFNARSGLPFYEGISTGCVAFDGAQTDRLPELLRTADALLYEAKKHRRRSVLREVCAADARNNTEDPKTP